VTGIEKIVSLMALGVVGFGASRIRTVWAAEQFKRPEALQKIYTDVNQQCFDGKLPSARLDWAVLKAPEASGATLNDGKDFIILLDPTANPTAEEAAITMRHEACHLWVGLGEEAEEHGSQFEACKARLQKFGPVR
jgi:hypothetical protein